MDVTFGRRNIPNRDELVKAWGEEQYVALQDGKTFTPSASKIYTVVGLMEPLFDETGMPAAFPALTYLDPAHLAAADNVDISILARDPRLYRRRPGDRLRHHDGLRRDDPQRQHCGYDQRRKFVGS